MAHQAGRDRVDSQRLHGHPVLAELRVPFDDVAVHLIGLGHRQAQLRVREHQPRRTLAGAETFQPIEAEAATDRCLKYLLLGGAERAQAHRASLHAAAADVHAQRVRGKTWLHHELQIEGRLRVGHVEAARRDDLQPMRAGRDGNGLDQGPERELAGVPVEVVHAVRARIEAVDDDCRFTADLEAPGLRVVTTGRPAALVKNVFDDGWVCHALASCCAVLRCAALGCCAAGCLIAVLACGTTHATRRRRFATCSSSICNGFALPPGRHVFFNRFR